MADYSIGFYERICLFGCTNCLSKFEIVFWKHRFKKLIKLKFMNLQEILTYICLTLAVGFLLKKFFWKKKANKKGCGDDCSCH
jgi:hypothetical protein